MIEHSEARSGWTSAALLMLLTIFLYWNSLEGSFHYDDFHSIVHNTYIRDAGNVIRFFVDTSMFSVDENKAMYRPLLLVSYTVNHALHGYDVMGYHVVNILLHGLCVVLVWSIARALCFRGQGALLAATLFCVHPLAVESVNYVSSRSELMAAFFFLGAFRAFMGASRLAVWTAVTLFAAGLLSKSIVIVLPLVLVVSDLWLLQRPLEMLRHLPLWGVAGIYGAILVTTRFLHASLSDAPRALDSQIYTQLKALPFYTKLLLVPVGLNVEHQFFEAVSLWQPQVVASLLILLSMMWVARRLSRVRRFWLVWVAITMVPTALIPLNVLVNEHRLYLPIAGLALLAAGVASAIRAPVREVALLVIAISVLLVVQRNDVWAGEMSLWSDSAAKSPAMVRPQVHLGNALRSAGRLEEASAAYSKAVAIDPTHRAANTNLANLYFERGLSAVEVSSARRHFEKAVAGYRTVLAEDPTYKEALGNFASANMMMGRFAEAEEAFLSVVRLHPRFADGFFNLGQLYMKNGKPVAAEAQFGKALLLQEASETRYELAIAQLEQGNLTGAAKSLRAALWSEPGNWRYVDSLTRVLGVLGERALQRGDVVAATAFWREGERCLLSVSTSGATGELAEMRMAEFRRNLRGAEEVQ